MMNNKTILSGLFLIVLSGLFLWSCSKMNDNIEEYLDRGEVNYLGRVDSATVHGGRERIQFVWKVSNDPRIEGCKIYWNDKADSVIIPIDRDLIDENRYFKAIVTDIKEGSYIFNMYHIGKKGYPSIRYQISGEVYGERYQSNLDIRGIQQITAQENNECQIDWKVAQDSCTVQLNYRDLADQDVEVIIPWDENKTILTDCPSGGTFSYKTIYRPEYQALDEFFVQSDTIAFPAQEEIDTF